MNVNATTANLFAASVAGIGEHRARALSALSRHVLAAHVDAADVAEFVAFTCTTRPITSPFALGLALARITTTGDARGVDRLEPAIWLLPQGEA